MKLLRLHLMAFGPFTDRVLDLSPEGESLVLIHGPNEAGKSSTLRAISDLRFGIPTQSSDNFIHVHRDMRIGGLFIDRSGTRHQLMRRKGRGNTLSVGGMGGDDGQAASSAVEAMLTGGFSKADYDSMFGLDHQRLRQGGEALLKGEGEVGAALFEASAGMRSVAAVLEQIDQSARKYFIPGTRGKNGVINEALRTYQEQHDGYRKALLRPAAWLDLSRRHKASEEALAQLELQRAQLNVQRLQASELRAVAPLLAAFDQASALASSLTETVVLAPSAPSARVAAETGLAQALEACASAQREIDRQQSLLSSQPADQAILDVGAAIERLTASCDTIDRHRQELALARADYAAEQRRAEGLARQIDPKLALEDVVALVPTPTQRTAIEQALTALERSRQALLQQRESTNAIQSDGTSDLPALPPVAQRAALAAARAQLLQHESQLQRRANLPALLKAAERTVALALTTLRIENESVLKTARPLPLEDIDAAMRLQQQHATRHDEIDKRIAAIERHRLVLDDQRCQMLAQGAIPSAAQVAAARQHREAGWQLIRQCHIDQTALQDRQDRQIDSQAALAYAGVQPLAQAYEEAVYQADHAIDALARDLQRAEQLQALDREIATLDVDRLALLDERQRLADEEALRQSGWLDGLRTEGLPTMSAHALRAWQSGLADARLACEQRDLLKEELAQADVMALELAATLSRAIEAIDEGSGAANGLSLAQLASLGDELETGLRQRESAYNNAVGKRQAQEQQRMLAAAREQELARRERDELAVLAPLMQDLHLDQHAGTEVARTRLAQFDTLSSASLQLNLAQSNGQRALNALALLENQAEAICRALGQTLQKGEHDVRLLAERLAIRLSDARKIETARNMARHALGMAQENLQREAALAQSHGAALDTLCAAAGVDLPALLPEAEMRSQRKQQAIADADRAARQLAQASRHSVDVLRNLLQQVDAAQLDADEATLTQELTMLEDAVRQARSAEEQARHALAAVSSADTAVVFQEGMERAAASIRGALAPWMRTRLAHGLLAEAQRRFRERAQGPMLTAASGYFNTMTGAEFRRLVSDESRDGEEPVLLAMRESGQLVRVEQLSEGTRDQLYLALRLAALDMRRSAGVDLPLILDDVLMTSDDERAALMLEALAGFSRQGQVIIFTHHAHLLEVARSVARTRLADKVLNIVELGKR